MVAGGRLTTPKGERQAAAMSILVIWIFLAAVILGACGYVIRNERRRARREK